MPKIWTDTVDAHREAVREATLDAAARLARQNGLTGLSMSDIAREAGIGRATLYKYFSDLPAVLAAWHERHVAAHLREFHRVATEDGPAIQRLRRVLGGYGETRFVQRGRHGAEIVSVLHAGEDAQAARQHLQEVLSQLIGQAASEGDARKDVAAKELATFCLHAIEATNELQSTDAVHRLVDLILAALSPVSR
jgi:AcrR family transcriptional regulator